MVWHMEITQILSENDRTRVRETVVQGFRKVGNGFGRKLILSACSFLPPPPPTLLLIFAQKRKPYMHVTQFKRKIYKCV